MPSGKVDQPVIEDNRDGTVSLKYEPREEGLHELYVKYNGEHVQGEFLICKYSIQSPPIALLEIEIAIELNIFLNFHCCIKGKIILFFKLFLI